MSVYCIKNVQNDSRILQKKKKRKMTQKLLQTRYTNFSPIRKIHIFIELKKRSTIENCLRIKPETHNYKPDKYLLYILIRTYV